MQTIKAPWIMSHYHAVSANRAARMVSRDCGKGFFPECLTNDGSITIGGDGPLYCFNDATAAQKAIDKANLLGL